MIWMVMVFLTVLNAENMNCDIKIETVKNSADTYTLVLKHDKNCEIIMDHNASHISLVSKDYEKKTDIVSVDKSVVSSDSKVEKIITLARTLEKFRNLLLLSNTQRM